MCLWFLLQRLGSKINYDVLEKLFEDSVCYCCLPFLLSYAHHPSSFLLLVEIKFSSYSVSLKEHVHLVIRNYNEGKAQIFMPLWCVTHFLLHYSAGASGYILNHILKYLSVDHVQSQPGIVFYLFWILICKL
jgi:hypothetical protein